ncbi:hypothetical protein A3K93_09175 [Acinetobacter sp. NCu2D-2]|uniref:hypothetical protein n=1 Tax=Acinetobacter sp. NCu2D-2 TaxID=1608473 RepID=UPI0007CDC528|nr:hypothetical protein [Acinetobacter sp. NCu2D-2]ANF82345.1 hypothetical protein A3K93_09175 [Acinetobacter sp. NCu2D-2]
MNKYLADGIFLIIATITVIYVAFTPSIRLSLIILACISIYFNYHWFEKLASRPRSKAKIS